MATLVLKKKKRKKKKANKVGVTSGQALKTLLML